MAEQDPAVALFGTEDFNLYDTLSLSKDASPSDIKSAYRRAALRCHPDKQSPAASEQDRQRASTTFQQVGYAYAVLSDQDRRKRYDATGSTEVSMFPENADAWQSYFEELWSGQVNAQSIDDFFAKYTGSEEERQDVLEAYKTFDGDIQVMLEHCMTQDARTAEDHLTSIVNDAIANDLVQPTDTWKASTGDKKAKQKRSKAAAKEAQEAEEMAKDMGVHDKLFNPQPGKGKKGKKADNDDGGEDALKALIQSRGKQRMDASISALEAKYGAGSESSSSSKGSKKGAGKKRKSDQKAQHDAPQEMNDDEFAALQAKMFGNKKDGEGEGSGSGSKRRKA